MTVQTWHWQGSDAAGRRRSGITPSPSGERLRAHLRRRGILVERITPVPAWLDWVLAARSPGVSRARLADFFRQLATLVEAGIPVVQALEMIAREEGGTLRPIVGRIRDDVAAGQPLSTALAAHPRLFDPLVCSLVRAGEQASALDTLLLRIAEARERSEAVRRRIRRAMLYPGIVITIAVAVCLALLGFVVPRFEAMFSGFGAELPAFTRALLGLSEQLRGGGWVVMLALLAGGTVLVILAGRVPALRRRRDHWLLRLPVLGRLQAQALDARFARLLAIMIQAGMPLAEALPALARAMDNTVYRDAVEAIARALDDGRSLEIAMASTGHFSETLTQMVAVGEETGRLATMLARVATLSEDAVTQAADGLGTLVEPLLMVFLGLLVGGLVLAMYLPVFRLGSVV